MIKTIRAYEGFIYLNDFKEFIETEKAVYYSLKVKKDGSVLVKLYDKKKKLIKPYDSRKD